MNININILNNKYVDRGTFSKNRIIIQMYYFFVQSDFYNLNTFNLEI